MSKLLSKMSVVEMRDELTMAHGSLTPGDILEQKRFYFTAFWSLIGACRSAAEGGLDLVKRGNAEWAMQQLVEAVREAQWTNAVFSKNGVSL